MAKIVSFKLEGLKELDEALKALPQIIARTVAANALKDAAEPLLEDLRTSTSFSDKTGNLRNSIGVQVLRKTRQGSFQVRIGARAPHAHLIEYGTKAHLMFAKKGTVLASYNRIMGMEVRHPGSKPRPFFRPAWHRRKGEIMDRLKTSFWFELDKAAEMLAKKAEAGTLSQKIRSQL